MQRQYKLKQILDEWWGALLALTMIMASLCVMVHYSEKIPKEEKHEPIVFVMSILVFIILMVFSLAIFPSPEPKEYITIHLPPPTGTTMVDIGEKFSKTPVNSEEDDYPNLTCRREHYE